MLKRDNLLVTAPDVDNKAIPAKIGNYPINDPQGFYKGQALAGYGIMYNTRYLKANKLAAPKDWDDLLKRDWFGHVAMTAPSRSGTMHLTVETILQGEGWDAGWGKVLEMAGQGAITPAIAERYALHDFVAAMNAAHSGKAAGRVVIVMD